MNLYKNDDRCPPFQNTVPDIYKALINIHSLISKRGVDSKLSHLVMLRASQMNQCSFCVEMHTREARADGETNDRLDLLAIHSQSQHFSEKEKWVLRWTEVLTSLLSQEEIKSTRKKLLEYCDEEEVAAITSLIGLINTWNRIRISEH